MRNSHDTKVALAFLLLIAAILIGTLLMLLTRIFISPANSQSGYCSTICDSSGKNCSTYCTGG
jgi:hypothetical protein